MLTTIPPSAPEGDDERASEPVPPAWLCGACGYSLDGLGAGTVCPECGARERVQRVAPTNSGRPDATVVWGVGVAIAAVCALYMSAEFDSPVPGLLTMATLPFWVMGVYRAFRTMLVIQAVILGSLILWAVCGVSPVASARDVVGFWLSSLVYLGIPFAVGLATRRVFLIGALGWGTAATRGRS